METADPIGVVQGNERRHVTALAVALIDFETRTSSLDPEVVQARSREFEDVVRTEVELRGGIVERISQGAAVCLFGALISHEDDPERGVRAALAIQDRVSSSGARLISDGDVGAGVSTSETIVAPFA